MKSLLTTFVLFFILISAANATPIFMQYEGVDGSFTQKVEVLNGKAIFKNLKAGTYKISITYTGLEMKGANGKPRSSSHVKVFDGRTGFSGGVRVAAGDVNGDGVADASTSVGGVNTMSAHGSGGGGGAGKVQMQDFHFVMKSVDGKSSKATGEGKVSLQDFHFVLKPNRGNTELSGQLGTYQLVGPSDSKASDTFFDVFTEISFE